eukprot:scaffold163_cov142-Isochrysis_galbana.AAC.2
MGAEAVAAVCHAGHLGLVQANGAIVLPLLELFVPDCFGSAQVDLEARQILVPAPHGIKYAGRSHAHSEAGGYR